MVEWHRNDILLGSIYTAVRLGYFWEFVLVLFIIYNFAPKW